jgi:hypothetical protein
MKRRLALHIPLSHDARAPKTKIEVARRVLQQHLWLGLASYCHGILACQRACFLL